VKSVFHVVRPPSSQLYGFDYVRLLLLHNSRIFKLAGCQTEQFDGFKLPVDRVSHRGDSVTPSTLTISIKEKTICMASGKRQAIEPLTYDMRR
jgi:hypothetical protein